MGQELGQKVSDPVADDVEKAVHAAIADPDAADAIACGMLTRALSSTGWEPVDLDGAVAVPEAKPADTRKTKKVSGRKSEQENTPQSRAASHSPGWLVSGLGVAVFLERLN